MSLATQITALATAVGAAMKTLAARVTALEMLGSPITAVPIVSGVATVDLSLGDYFTIALSSNATLAFSNPPAAGTGRTVDVTVTQDGTGGRTLTLPASMHPIGASDTAIQSAAGAGTKIVATTLDAGTTYAYGMAKVA